jgi:tripartite ATP-independent transporter DctP family solute receptor
MKKIAFLVSLVLILSLVFTGCGQKPAAESGDKGGAPQTEAKPVTLKWATSGPEDHQYTIGARKFEELIEAKSEGKIIVEIFPNSQLGGEREAIEGTKNGTITMTSVTSDGALPAWVPETQVFTIPYLFRDAEHVYKALDGEVGEYLGEKCEAQGFKHLGFFELGFRHFTNNKRPINEPADMKGLKIRVQEAPIWFALIEAVDGIATPIAFNELYSAMQQGVVDGQENPLRTISSMKYYEVQQYLALDAHTYAPGSVIMNLKAWNELPVEYQKLVQECVDEAVAYQRKFVSDKAAEDLQFLKDQGMNVTEPDLAKFAEATKHIAELDQVKKLVPQELIDMVRNIK